MVRVQSLVHRDSESRTNIRPCDVRILPRPNENEGEMRGVNRTRQVVKMLRSQTLLWSTKEFS